MRLQLSHKRVSLTLIVQWGEGQFDRFFTVVNFFNFLSAHDYRIMSRLLYQNNTYNDFSYNDLSYTDFSYNDLSYNDFSYNDFSYNDFSYNDFS